MAAKKLSVERGTQLAVFLSNTPGALVRVCDELAHAGINIHALSVSDTADHSVVRMVVSDTTKALMLLGERGVLAIENDVLMIDCDNEPGTLAKLAEKLSGAQVNIQYLYSTMPAQAEKGLMVLRPSDVEKAQSILREC